MLDDAELKLTWQAADAAGGAVGTLVKLLMLTRARRNEMMELARDEIKADAIELPGERTKKRRASFDLFDTAHARRA